MKRKTGWTARNAILLGVLTSLIVLSVAGAAAAYVPGGTLDPTTIPKFVDPLVIPPAMPETSPNYYEIAVKQFQQQIMPAPLPQSTVWSYGLAGNLAGTLNYPAFTIEATANERIDVKWINGLVDDSGNYLPHLFAIDQTLHWANPNKSGMAGTTDSMGDIPTPYTGPVPIITHVHGAHVGPESDGYPEAWYLPAANNIPAGYATRGSHWGQVAGKPVEDGAAYFSYPNDQAAATLWYHDHALGMTRNNVMAGPAGFYLVRGGPNDLDPSGPVKLPGPAPALGDAPGTKYYEIPIAIQDRSFNTDGSIFFPENRAFFEGLNPYVGAGSIEPYLNIPFIPDTANGGQPSDVAPIWNPEFFGNTIVVNGKTWPYLEVEARRYRFRFLNGTNARALILKTDVPVPMTQIGGDQGFLPAPLPRTELLMMPAERNDMIVDFTDIAPGTTVTLQNVGPDSPFNGVVDPAAVADTATTGQVMEFRVVAPTGTDPSTDPATITSLPSEDPLGAATVTRHLSLNEEESASVTVTTDGAGNVVYDPNSTTPFGPTAAKLGTFDPATGIPTVLRWMDPITETPALGATEVWEIRNYTMDAHPIHLHLVSFDTIEREIVDNMSPHWTGLPGGSAGDIVPRETWEAGRKDTVIAYPGEITRVKAMFDVAGLYVWHCHIIDHEDNEMMRAYRVAIPKPNVTAPNAGGTFTQGDVVPVSWNLAPDAGAGVMHAYAYTAAGGYVWLNTQAAVSGQTSYSFNWTVAQAPGSGYTIRVWYVDGAGNWLTFDGSDAPFTIQAGAIPTPTVTAPNAGGTYSQGGVVPVSWNLAPTAGTGVMHAYAYTSAGGYVWLNTQAAVSGQTAYSFNWTVAQAPGSGYTIRVWYVDGAGNWLTFDGSDAPFTIAAGSLPTPTVTAPNTGGTFTQGDSVPVSWNLAPTTGTGVMHAYAYTSAGGYVWLNSQAAVSGQTAYSFNWTVAQAPGSGYTIRVWYVDGAGDWLAFDGSDAPFTIAAGSLPTPTVTAPNTGGTFTQGDSVPVSWNLAPTAGTGVMHAYAYTSAGGYVWLNTQAAVSGQTAYSFNWTVAQAPGSGYTIRVWYVDGAGNWLAFDGSDAPFTIN